MKTIEYKKNITLHNICLKCGVDITDSIHHLFCNWCWDVIEYYKSVNIANRYRKKHKLKKCIKCKGILDFSPFFFVCEECGNKIERDK